MELGAQEERVLLARQFRDLHQAPVGRNAGEDQSFLFQAGYVVRVHLVAMAVPLGDEALAVSGGRDGSRFELRGIRAQAHGRAVMFFLQVLLLLRHHVDDRMGGLGIYLGRIRVLHARAPRELRDHELHAVAQAEIRYLLLPAIADGRDLALYAPAAEPSRHDHPVIAGKLGKALGLLLELFRGEPDDLRRPAQGGRGVLHALDDRNVRILQDEITRAEIFAHDPDPDHILSAPDPGHQTAPLVQVAALGLQAQLLDQPGADVLFFEIQRHLVDALHVRGGNDVALAQAACVFDLFLALLVERDMRPGEDDVGVEPDRVQAADRVLGGLGLELIAARTQGGHETHQHQHHIAGMAELQHPHRFQKKNVLVFSRGAADLGDDDLRLVLFGGLVDALDHFHGNARYHLHLPAAVFQIPLLLDDRQIDAAGGHVVGSSKVPAQKALIIAHILVALRAVIQDKNLAVFGGIHGSGIHVHIGIDLDGGHRESPGLQYLADGRRGDALADARHNSPNYEYVLGSFLVHGALILAQLPFGAPGTGRSGW